MNLLHLKYAVEIAETASMTKAAENLYTAQPNLSRAVRELESVLGIEIFRRTPKGIYPTPQGEEFLARARKILASVDEVEQMYRAPQKNLRRFSISVPRASYISCAFTEFLKTLGQAAPSEIYYKETNAQRAVSNIINADYKLAILRYQSSYDRYFKDMFKEKGLDSSLICEFKHMLLMSEKHPLAEKEQIFISDLTPYTALSHPDPFVPSMPLSTVRKNEQSDRADRRIYISERGSQMDILSELHDAFIWESPVPARLLERYGLLERVCADEVKKYRDVLVYKKDYQLSELDKAFIDELTRFKRDIG